MKIIFIALLSFLNSCLFAQDTDNEKWFLLEGVTNAQYKVYLDIGALEYEPGVTIIAKLKYEYKDDNLIDYITKDVKFAVSENTYQIINQAHFSKKGRVDVEPSEQIRHLMPGSEMSVIYQGVYIQAVTKGPTQK